MVEESQSERSLEEQALETNTVFEGNLLQVFQDRVQLPNGNITGREVVSHPGGAVIVPLVTNTDPVQLVMVEQFRYPAESTVWELPAGKKEQGETALACAKRELGEETGYGKGEWHKKVDFYTTPGYSDEVLTMFVATGIVPLSEGARLFSPDDEELRCKEFSINEVIELATSGLIRDGKTLAGLFFLVTAHDS